MAIPFQKLVVAFAIIAVTLCSKVAVGQDVVNALPITRNEIYVIIPTEQVVANQVKTQRLRNGKPEQIDLIDVLCDVRPLMDRTGAIPGLTLNGTYYEDQLLVTMAVLPDKVSGLVTWEPVNEDSIHKMRQLPFDEVLRDGYTRTVDYKKRQPYVNALTRRLDFRPVLIKAGQYWTTRNTVLTEYFLVRSQPLLFPTGADNVTINYRVQSFTHPQFQEMKRRLSKEFPVQHTRPVLEGELQTKILLEKKEGDVFSFWSIPPRVTDAEITCFGAVEFKFIPSIGLVSGKYPNYFDLANESSANTFFEVVSIQPLHK